MSEEINKKNISLPLLLIDLSEIVKQKILQCVKKSHYEHILRFKWKRAMSSKIAAT